MAADIAPPTDAEAEAIHVSMIGAHMGGSWTEIVKIVIGKFLAMRAEAAPVAAPYEPDTRGWRSPEMADAAKRMGME